jgi:hypothetical protein
MFAGLQYDYFLAKKWFAWGLTRGERDGVADLDLRATAGVGAGYQIFEREDLKLSLEAGPTWIGEWYEGGEQDEFLALRVGWKYEQLLASGITAFHNANLYPSFALDDYFLERSTGLRYKLFGDFFGETKLLWLYDPTPADDREKADLTLLFGIGYDF